MRRAFLTLSLFLLLFVSTQFTQAARREGISWSADCGGFVSNGGGILMNRDNTGAGRETIVITGVDGNGTVIFGPVEETVFVGLSLEFPEGLQFRWGTEPTANPLTVSVVSVAGNGLGEQVVYVVDGFCSVLPLAVNPTQAPVPTAIATATPAPRATTGIAFSPGVVLNTSPAYPTNPDGIGETRDGYLIVTSPNVNLRSGDGPQYTIVGRITGGEELIVLGVNRARTWWLVQVGEVRGWINNELVLVRGDLTFTPVIEDAGGIIFPPRFYVYNMNNLLASPREGAAVVCVIDGDLEYLIAGQNRDGSWFALQTECGEDVIVGWIKAENGAIRNTGDLPIPVIPG